MKTFSPIQLLLRVNPLLKIAFTLLALTLAFAIKTLAGMAVLVGFLLLLLILGGRVVPWIWLVGGGVLLLITGVNFYFTQDLTYALLTASRIVAILLPAPLLASTTAPEDLIRALQTIRLPAYVVLGVILVWRFLPLIQEEANRIREANLLRGVDLGWEPQKLFSGLFVPLVFRMVTYADEVTIGLETRGYDPLAPRSSAVPLGWRKEDWGFIGLVGLLLTGILGWETGLIT